VLLSNLFRISHFRRSSTAEYSPTPLIALIVRAFLESVSHMISLQHKCILTNKLTTVAKVEMPCSKAEIGYLLITLLRRKVGLLLFWGIPPNPLQYDVACRLLSVGYVQVACMAKTSSVHSPNEVDSK